MEEIKNSTINFNKQWFYEKDLLGDFKIEAITDNTYNGFYLFSFLIDTYQKMHNPGTFVIYVVL